MRGTDILSRARGLAMKAGEPWIVLVPLLLVYWVALVLYTASVRHNGWLFYQGGDQIWYWTSSWLLAHGAVTLSQVAQGWPLLLLPFSALGGPGFLGGLPGTVLLQVLVLAPIALWCVYEIGARIGGRLVGYLGAALWTLGPYLAIPLFVDRYHEKYVEQFLPHPLGLTAMADHTGVVFLLVAAAFSLRAIEEHGWRWALLTGMAAGFAGLIKPSTFVFLAAPAILFLAARKGRCLVAFAAGLGPALGALALWKYQTLGYLPAFNAQPETRLALGGSAILHPYHKYVNVDWHHLDINLQGLAENFFSLRVLQWLPFAGALAVARRSISVALFLSTWFWLFLVVKGSNENSSVDSGSFFRFVLPGLPALVIMAAALPLLVPRYGEAVVRRLPPPSVRPVSTTALVAAALVLSLAPIVAAAIVTPLHGPKRSVWVNRIGVVVDPALDLRLDVRGRTVLLRWDTPKAAGSRIFYKLLRARGSTDVTCGGERGASECDVFGSVAATTGAPAYSDRPGPGTWTYRVGVGANWLDDPRLGDIFVVSRPLTVTLRR